VVRRAVAGALSSPLLSLVLAALAATGCSGKLFRPRTPPEAADADARVRIEHVYVTKFPGSDFDEHFGARLALEVERRPGASLGRARLTSARLTPCASGLIANEASTVIDHVGPETQVLAFSRPGAVAAGFFDDGTAALDLAIFPADRGQQGRCLRIPLFDTPPSAAPEAAWVHHAFLLAGEERLLVLHSTIPGLKSPALLLGVGMGGWSGRWRWMIEGEGGFSDRLEAAPPAGAAGSSALFGLWGGGASASTLLLARGHFGLGALGGYEVLRGVPGGGTGPKPETLTLHGPRVGLRFIYLIDPLRWPGFASPLDSSVGALAVYAGDWWSGAEVGHQSPFLGFALEGNLAF
jgi:hypothetical protein